MEIYKFIINLTNELYKNSFYNIKINKEYNNLDKTFLLHIRCNRNKKNYSYGISIHEKWLNGECVNDIVNRLLSQ